MARVEAGGAVLGSHVRPPLPVRGGGRNLRRGLLPPAGLGRGRPPEHGAHAPGTLRSPAGGPLASRRRSRAVGVLRSAGNCAVPRSSSMIQRLPDPFTASYAVKQAQNPNVPN